MSALRRYEIFLPRRFNDGTLVPDELIANTLLELRGDIFLHCVALLVER